MAKAKSVIPGKILTPRQQRMFVKYFPMVGKIVNSMRRKLPPYADLDELHSVGVSGLADTVGRLDFSRKRSFDSYVAARLRGAVLDGLRKIDYMPRSARSDAKRLERIRNSLEQRYGRAPTDFEVRREMGISRKQYAGMLRRTRACSFVSLNDIRGRNSDSASFAESIVDENARGAYENMERTELSESLRRNVAALPEKQRRVIEGYYFQKKNLGEIAGEFGLSEARICQIHSKALDALRPKFDWQNARSRTDVAG